MSTFKLKPSKVRQASNICTLDEIYRNQVCEFNKRKQLIPKKKKKVDILKKKLDSIEKRDPSTYTLNDIEQRSILKTQIDNINKEIFDIENDDSEMEYYSKSVDILMDYFDILENDNLSTYSNGSNNSIKSINSINSQNSIGKLATNAPKKCLSKEKKLDALDKLNLLNKKRKTKHKKPTKRRKKTIVVNNDIRNFLGCNVDKSSAEYKQKQKNNRAACLDRYRLLVDNDYIPDIQHSNLLKYCDGCGYELILSQSEGNYVCKNCGLIEIAIVESDRPNYKDPIPEKPGYPYKRINHFNEWLSQFQAKESTEIPKNIYDMILDELHKDRFYNFKDLSVPYIRIKYMKSILKKLGFTQYYEHAVHIISKLSGIPPPTINRDTEERLRYMFKQIQTPFEKHCPKSRINFLSYSYVLHKFCQLLELDKFIICFPLLKSREKLRQQDKIWENICSDLRWEFIPSV